jgi:hypothetical protein
MCIVEADQPRSIRRVKCKRIGQAVWPALGRLYSFDLEPDPVTFLEMMNAPIERQQELERMIKPRINHIM